MPRKGENIYHRKDGRWEGRYIKGRKPDGRPRFGFIYGKQYSEVKKRLIVIKSELYRKPDCLPIAYGSIKLCDWADYWLEAEIRPHVRPETYAGYRRNLDNHICPHMGGMAIADITPLQVQHLADSLSETLAPSTLHGICRLLKSMFGAAAEKGLLRCTPYQNIRLPKSRCKSPRVLTQTEQRKLEEEIFSNNEPEYLLCLYMGLRVGELCALRWEDVDFENSREKEFAFLSEQGFEVVEYHKVTPESVAEKVDEFEKKVAHYDIPSDGLVLTYEDIAYGESLGQTSKFPRNSIAFKWQDEIRETELLEIEWSPSRTGLINPVAIFKPVELEGTTVSRASVHNISILRSLQLGIGDRITVYKANMIIPQIAENLTAKEAEAMGKSPAGEEGDAHLVEIPACCPVCGRKTEVRQVNDVKSLYCTNEKCAAKQVKAFTLFVSRDAMNIDGLSEATLEKFIDSGFIHEFADLFHLDRYQDKIVEMEGFGEKSYRNLMESIDRARNTILPRVVYGLGIANIGVANAKMLCRYFDHDLKRMQEADVETLSAIEGVGEVIATAFVNYMRDGDNLRKIENLMEELRIEIPRIDAQSQNLAGLSFVITGSLNKYASRSDLKEAIEQRGGKVTGSVTGKTTCLINNDVASTSSKNKKARELGIPVLSEEDFLGQYGMEIE